MLQSLHSACGAVRDSTQGTGLSALGHLSSNRLRHTRDREHALVAEQVGAHGADDIVDCTETVAVGVAGYTCRVGGRAISGRVGPCADGANRSPTHTQHAPRGVKGGGWLPAAYSTA